MELVLEQAFQRGIEKCLRDAKRLDGFPHTTRDGRWLTNQDGHWTGGFFVGMLWLACLEIGSPRGEELALNWTQRLGGRRDDDSSHNLGFLFEPSHVRGLRISGRSELREGALLAARALARRYRSQGRYIPAWSSELNPDYEGLAIVDTVMNLPLLFWAAEESGEGSLSRIGCAVGTTIAGQHLRPDGSSIHVIYHDPLTGRPLKAGSHQGASADSCWTRGQAWTLHGFTRLAALTADPGFLEVARRAADHYLMRLGSAAIPPWDFDRTDPSEPRDASAAAIAASGLLELARVTAQQRYRLAAERMLREFATTCVDFEHPDAPGLVLHATVDLPHGSGVDVSTVYDDHYFLEALFKLCRLGDWHRLGCVANYGAAD
jgi:unsaturated chondroitin disaccharide hydrolase